MSLDPDERQRRLQEASRTLREGGSVVMPTETVYGLFTQASDDGARLLAQLTSEPQVVNTPMFTLHLGDPQPIVPMLTLDSPVARRLVHRLMPGAVRFVLRQPESVLGAVCETVGIGRGLIDDGESVALRLPDHPIARAVIRGAGGWALARGVGASRWGSGQGAGDLESTRIYEDEHEPPDALIDDGPTLHAKGSTTIDLWPQGRFSVHAGGAVDEAQVMRVLTTRVLFVCTGNTCRSPMAEGLARAWSRGREPDGLTLEMDSAGIAAGEGHPAADAAVQTVHERGGELGAHQSKPLTPELVDWADAIFTMTPSHAQAVMQMAPGSVHKVYPIDPLHPVEDPVGQPIGVYREVGDQLSELVAKRLQEIIDE